VNSVDPSTLWYDFFFIKLKTTKMGVSELYKKEREGMLGAEF
jgi:hypothetical protein